MGGVGEQLIEEGVQVEWGLGEGEQSEGDGVHSFSCSHYESKQRMWSSPTSDSRTWTALAV